MTRDYERALKRLDNQFTFDASLPSQSKIILDRLGVKWERIFSNEAKDIMERFERQTSRDSQKKLEDSLKELAGGMTIEVPVMPEALKEKVKAITYENVDLIKSVSSEFHDEIKGYMMRQMSGDGSLNDLYSYLREVQGKSHKRASFIARDQTFKLTSAMNSERMKASGVEQFEWVHSGGGANPRPLHVRYDGQIFSFSDPPIIDERTGERGLPGQAINCRCRMRPVLTF